MMRVSRLGSFTLMLVLACGGETSKLADGSSRPKETKSAAGRSGADPAAQISAAGTSIFTQSPGGATGGVSTLVGGTGGVTALAGVAGTSVWAMAGNGSTQAAAGAAAVFGFDGIPVVGATVSNPATAGHTGTVLGVNTGNDGYSSVKVLYEPEWSCPPDAMASAGSIAPGTPAGTVSGAVGLAAANCRELAALRRPVLKADSLSNLAMSRAGLIATKCQKTLARWCIDANGTVVDQAKCLQLDLESVADPPPGLTEDPPSSDGVEPGTTDSSTASSYSTTNTQVANVDEPDFVKNDGNTIFVLSADGLHVIDAWPAPETRELARIALPGEPRRLLLSDNRLVVYSRLQAGASTGAGSSNPSDQGCTYGYGCRFSSEGGHTLATVFDVSSPAAPRELVRYEWSGGFVAARRIGSSVYTVVHDTGAPQIPNLDLRLQANSFAELEATFAARVAQNDSQIDATSDEYFVPWTQTIAPTGAVAIDSSCGQGLAGADSHAGSFVSLTAFDLAQLQPLTRTVVGINPGFVYASPAALYLAVDQVPEAQFLSASQRISGGANSVVHKFALNGITTSYRGSAPLPGHILNQFAMDERDGVLRVASTAGWVPNPGVISYLTTFAEATGTLAKLGEIGGIAPDEDIRAVRFDADRGFVVTFKKTDPLFVFDLSIAATPRLLGELMIPGFSTYLHRLDANHLLAVGFEADDKGSYAYFNGIQIQIFDVTDLTQPALLHKRVIGTRGSGSEALTNHLAFTYFAPKKMLALPITVCEGGGNGTYADQLTFAGLMAFDISLESGITEHGRLDFVYSSTVAINESCAKWWTDSTSLVKRSIFLDDWVYGLSDAQLRVANLASMDLPVAVVSLSK